MIKAEKRTFKMGAYLTDVDHVFVTSTDCNPEEWIPLIEQEFTIEVPEITDYDMNKMLIGGLEKEIEEVEKEAYTKVSKIKDKIQKLLALPNLSEIPEDYAYEGADIPDDVIDSEDIGISQEEEDRLANPRGQ